MLNVILSQFFIKDIKMRCSLRFTLIFISVFSLSVAKDTLNFAVSKNVGPLNPHLYSPNEMFAQNMVYEGLVDYSESGIIPKLALSWEISEDGTNYTFHLRKDAVFSNGEKFNASAVKSNFDAIMDNKKRHSWLELTNIIKSYEVKDEYTFVLNIDHPYEPTLRELALVRPFRFIAPTAMINGGTKDGIKEAIGTGAYILKESKLGVYDKFVANKKHYEFNPKYDEILAKVIPDPNTKVIALKTGEVDLIYGNGQITLDSFNELKKDYPTIISKPMLTMTLALNSSKFPTSDLSVRTALNMILDKDMINEKLFYKTQKKADFLFNPNLSGANLDVKAHEFDIKKANEILENDGWILKGDIRYKDNKPLNLELVYIGSDTAQKGIAEILQANAKKIGANVELIAQESTIFYKRQKNGTFNLIFNNTWGAPYDPVAFLASMRAPSHADFMAQSGLENKALIDKKITEILSTLDVDKRNSLIKEVLTIFHNEAIYIPITYMTDQVVYRKNVDGVSSDIVKYNIKFWEFYPVKNKR